jgi:hypothetical protein
VDGLRDDPAILNDERVSPVADASVIGFGRPFQERDPACNQSVGVGVWRVGKFLGQYPGEFAQSVVATEDAPALQDDAVGREVALDVLLELMLAGQAQVVLEDLLRRARGQILGDGCLSRSGTPVGYWRPACPKRRSAN